MGYKKNCCRCGKEFEFNHLYDERLEFEDGIIKTVCRECKTKQRQEIETKLTNDYFSLPLEIRNDMSFCEYIDYL